MQRFHSVKSEWGLPKFLPHKIFKEAGYLVYDKCSFGAEILVGQGSGSVLVGRKKKRIKHIQRQAVGECLSMVKSNNSFKREWKIRNFSNLGVDWMSEEFTVADHKWKIRLYPKSEDHTEGCQISIYLLSVDFKDFDPNQKVKANCSICINDLIKSGGYKRSYCTWFSTTVQAWGYSRFMPLNSVA
ncbi:hypothetical protein KY290_007749 [Solanum tuberosum]|uniref:MATH domain-containing protein n=1 Tax=Solanum tuberosum TaxID=4113 RepID=A0ABQ7W8D3_SOLTU|nr:hypothetical protein KY290_007749 [Solanum tuberosum]